MDMAAGFGPLWYPFVFRVLHGRFEALHGTFSICARLQFVTTPFVIPLISLVAGALFPLIPPESPFPFFPHYIAVLPAFSLLGQFSSTLHIGFWAAHTLSRAVRAKVLDSIQAWFRICGKSHSSMVTARTWTCIAGGFFNLPLILILFFPLGTSHFKHILNALDVIRISGYSIRFGGRLAGFVSRNQRMLACCLLG